MGIEVVDKAKQEWRNRLADKVRSGEYVVFGGGRNLDYKGVMTSDLCMVDMIYITREEMEAAGNNPQTALINRVKEIHSSQNNSLEALIVKGMENKMVFPFFKRALGDNWKD